MAKRLYSRHDLYERDGGGLSVKEVDFILRIEKMPQIAILLRGMEQAKEDHQKVLGLIEELEDDLKRARDLSLELEHNNGLYYHDLKILTQWYRDAGA